MTHNDDHEGRFAGTVPLVGDVLSLHPSPTLKIKNKKKIQIFEKHTCLFSWNDFQIIRQLLYNRFKSFSKKNQRKNSVTVKI